MTDLPRDAGQFQLLATFIAGHAVEVTHAPPGHSAHTDGQVIFVTAAATSAEQRREVVVQSALLAAGSLQPQVTRALQARPRLARRYLWLEGQRALSAVADRVPLAATLCPEHQPASTGAAESLAIAKSRRHIPDPPDWFGVIKPPRLLARTRGPRAPADNDLHFDPPDPAGPDAEADDSQSGESKILKLFEAPAFTSRTLSEFLRKLLGSSPSYSEDSGGVELQLGTVRRGRGAGPDARPVPLPIQFTGAEKPGAAMGVGGALYPEWDAHNNHYRPEWCRVIDFPLPASRVTPTGAISDSVLRQRLSRVGLGPKAVRGRPDGDELDTDALVDLFIDLRSGYSPPEHIYTERRKLRRDLGVLILLDTSGSATDTDAKGHAVHEHQRQAAATLATTLDELGDRVAVYGFRSEGRHAVHLPAVKSFQHRFGAAERARLDQLQPSGYTRLGAGIRGAGEILKTQAGTPNRLLLVLSDGFPYDDGYEGRYAQADSAKALEELRLDGVACLCLSIGAQCDSDVLQRVFGPASHASAATLSELSPVMDQLFMSALRDLAAPMSRRA
ncbi:VWA domain-containing protein [Mycobacterium sp. OTB74]|uniref:nitric oxide reductase activation protein NorD n=1 Tax=Mycobacterium sp. OTB74 TaxID=1853452 RepID=UPI002475950F|nr:VWA domain-containing protein [Mycobacterium sp. OTB74]MDH6245347.1 nitric oxide reductase NorD protein [Mycobacterium sp. OTB74]